MNRFVPAVVAAATVTVFSACVTVPHDIREREDYWRQVLDEQAPVGTDRQAVMAMFAKHDLDARTGTYRTAHADGSESSHCRLPASAVSAMERGAARGLYLNWDIEVTVCMNEQDTVESHFVGTWNAGI